MPASLRKSFDTKSFFIGEAKFRLIILAENPPEEMLEEKKFGSPWPTYYIDHYHTLLTVLPRPSH